MDVNTKYAIIGGSTKCGTTSVFKYFEFHPEICPCKMKESRYFLEDNYRLVAKKRDSATYNHFDDLFIDCKSKIKFEATPDYLYSKSAAEKIKTELDGVKIIFILRNPVDRLKSWYKFAKLNGLINDQMSFAEYINIQKIKTNEQTPQHLRSLEQGKYSDYVHNYYNIFDKKDIVICYYEHLEQDPKSFCKSLSIKLNIDPDYFNDYDFKIHNKSVAVKSVEAHKLFRKIKRTIRPATRLLHNSFRKKLKLAGYKLEQAYSQANKATNEVVIDIDETLKNFLNEYYSKETVELTKLTGTNPHWHFITQQENK